VKKKIAVFSILTILCVLFITQTSAVSAGKPTSIYFYALEWQIDDSNVIDNEDGLPWIGQFELSGSLTQGGGFFAPPTVWATFTCVETIKFYYDRAGDLKYSKRTGVMELDIEGSSDTLTINFKFKIVPGVPSEFQDPGSWVIVDGTGIYAAVSGRGEYRFPFQFYGTIK